MSGTGMTRRGALSQHGPEPRRVARGVRGSTDLHLHRPAAGHRGNGDVHGLHGRGEQRNPQGSLEHGRLHRGARHVVQRGRARAARDDHDRRSSDRLDRRAATSSPLSIYYMTSVRLLLHGEPGSTTRCVWERTGWTPTGSVRAERRSGADRDGTLHGHAGRAGLPGRSGDRSGRLRPADDPVPGRRSAELRDVHAHALGLSGERDAVRHADLRGGGDDVHAPVLGVGWGESGRDAGGSIAVVNGPPVVNAPPGQQVNVFRPLTANVSSSDPDGDVLDLTARGTAIDAGSSRSSINGDGTGTLSWTSRARRGRTTRRSRRRTPAGVRVRRSVHPGRGAVPLCPWDGVPRRQRVVHPGRRGARTLRVDDRGARRLGPARGERDVGQERSLHSVSGPGVYQVRAIPPAGMET